ncbi:MAG TPA: molecular chaperone DnaK [Gemmataceae bacterium]|jgi:molecular chaperone DnaK|nr:molecular chaperone DnaK [Gemmataceae bacterium]
MAEKIIGIDLGTTNSVVAVMEGTQVTVIPLKASDRKLLPSVVAFTDKGERLVGDPAKRQAVTNPTRTVYSIKRFMGRRHYEVEAEEKLVPYKIVGGPQDLVKVDIDGKQYTPPEISAMILRYLKESAEAYLGQTVKKAVITVPAYFNDSQRQATIDAAIIAGFEGEWEIQDPKTGKINKQRMRIINEPTAAALAYHLDKKKDSKIAVFDLGGGTFDISILDVGEDGVFQVKATNGDTHLGGDDFDQVIIDYIADEFKKENNFDLRKDPMALQRLKEAAEQAKKDLSTSTEASIKLPFICAIQGQAKHLDMTLTRSKFEKLVDHLVERCRGPVMQAMKDAGYKTSDVDEVVMVGGMTRVPRIQQLVKEIYGKEGHRGVNPDEVVAVGAAIQGAQLLLGSQSNLLLLDVTPLTLGIEANHGRMIPIIPRNTAIPTKKSDASFTTAADNQTSVEIQVYQGERPMAGDNKRIGTFFLEGIPPAPRHTPRIEVTFDIDANGILHVSAKDLGTGKEQKIRIENSSGLSQDEIDRMKRDAEVHAEDDKKKKELVDARNKADALIYALEKAMKEAGSKLSDSDKAPIQSAIEKLKSKMEGNDAAAINQAIAELEQASQAMAQHLHGQGQTGGGVPTPTSDGQGGGTAPKGDDVIDADFEVKK